MPKRIVDGEGLWRSEKLLEVSAQYRAEFANLIPLALANGAFELGTSRSSWGKRIHSIAYSFNRPGVTPEMVDTILGEFYRAKLLFVWADTTGKFWGYWVGINKPGRLPSASRQDKKHEASGAEPPADELQKYLESTPETLASQWLTIGQPMASKVLVLDLDSALVLDKALASDKPSSSELKGSSDKASGDGVISGDSGRSPKASPTQPSAGGERLAALLKAEILGNKPDAKITPAQERRWAATADRMMRLDGRTEDAIAGVIRWAQRDPFWMANILCMDKLRKQFDQLDLKRQQTSGAGRTTKGAQPQYAALDHLNHTAGLAQQADGTFRL